MKLYVSHSPVRRSQISPRLFKSIKTSKGIGGKIVINVFGDSIKECEDMAAKIVELWNNDIEKNNHPV